MSSTPENHLQQAEHLARQAAARMREAAELADQATQLFQHALALVNAKQLDEASGAAYMSIATPRGRKKASKQAETIKLIESLTQRTSERCAIPTPPMEAPGTVAPTHAWNEGDDWWKPLPPITSQ